MTVDQVKLSHGLAEHVAGGAPGAVEVIVELRHIPVAATGRADRVEAVKAAFARDAQDVIARIAEAGGTDVQSAWLNRTLRCMLPVSALSRVAALHQVSRIDLPAPLRRTAGGGAS